MLVLTRTTAVKLIYKEKTNTAIGVEVIQDGVCKTLYAHKEIILTIGIHSAEKCWCES